MQKLGEKEENSDILRLKLQVVVAKVYENNIDSRIINSRPKGKTLLSFELVSDKLIVSVRVSIYKLSQIYP